MRESKSERRSAGGCRDSVAADPVTIQLKRLQSVAVFARDNQRRSAVVKRYLRRRRARKRRQGSRQGNQRSGSRELESLNIRGAAAVQYERRVAMKRHTNRPVAAGCGLAPPGQRVAVDGEYRHVIASGINGEQPTVVFGEDHSALRSQTGSQSRAARGKHAPIGKPAIGSPVIGKHRVRTRGIGERVHGTGLRERRGRQLQDYEETPPQ